MIPSPLTSSYDKTAHDCMTVSPPLLPPPGGIYRREQEDHQERQAGRECAGEDAAGGGRAQLAGDARQEGGQGGAATHGRQVL